MAQKNAPGCTKRRRTTMKKILQKKTYLPALIAVLVFAVGLSSCGAPSPSDVVTAEFNRLSKVESAQFAEELKTDGLGVVIPDDFLKQLQSFTFAAGEEIITEDTATVALTITTYDFGSVYTAVREKYLEEYYTRSNKNQTDKEVLQELFDAFFAAAADADFSYSKTLIFSLSKIDGKWALENLSEEESNAFGDALWGGLLSAMILSPANVVKEEFDAFIHENTAQLAEEMAAKSGIVYPDNIINMLKSVEYTLGAETINGDHASVDVSITTYDFGSVFLTSTEAYLKDYGSRLRSGDKAAENLSGEELAQEMFEAFFVAAPDAEFSRTEALTLSLSKTDGIWVLDALDENVSFSNAIWGGLLSAPEEMNEKMQDSAYVDSLMK
jgi:hypothetical protein